ncbi:MAG: hypothetical protein EZS28_051507 [Streblomastix strix]|uniref:Uncharacterized protein n=1 Tax=Streblomastix strix TaxID=222440 RepID=A0A5J4T3F1_9EUKA|nr:MAG: hypothetical protein EZS28_051507 [Streblomastix strix]
MVIVGWKQINNESYWIAAIKDDQEYKYTGAIVPMDAVKKCHGGYFPYFWEYFQDQYQLFPLLWACGITTDIITAIVMIVANVVIVVNVANAVHVAIIFLMINAVSAANVHVVNHVDALIVNQDIHGVLLIVSHLIHAFNASAMDLKCIHQSFQPMEQLEICQQLGRERKFIEEIESEGAKFVFVSASCVKPTSPYNPD